MKTKAHSVVGDRRLRRLAAFTMVEIALALAVIAFALVAIIGVLPAGMSVQKDNRESTIVNFDANFLMDAIKSGTVGLDDLTNHVIVISNIITFFNTNGDGTITPGASQWIAYSTNGTTGSKISGGPLLTNGANIIALLTIPKYVPVPGGFYSNYISADFRAITGSLSDQGTSQSARDFAFAYRVFPEVIPYFAADTILTNSPNSGITAHNLQANFTQIRLRFRWPILPNGQVGNSRLTFRTAAGGQLAMYPALVARDPIPVALVQPGTYVGVSQ
jgi:type II secretory pathway pseudopilin PulG